MKKIFMNNCTGCHPPGYLLQFRFDEAGWSKVIDLMKVVPGSGRLSRAQRAGERDHGPQPEGAGRVSGARARTG